MKTLLKLIAGLILVVVIAAIIAIQLISTEDVINEVSTKVEQPFDLSKKFQNIRNFFVSHK